MPRNPKSDPQRAQLYRMEKRGLPGLNRAQFTRGDHLETAKVLSRAFGVDTPQVVFRKSKNWAGLYEPGDARIYLSLSYPSGLAGMTLVHELAHHFVYRWDPEEHLAPHGPEFVGVYGDALGMTGLIPWKGWQYLCDKYGVKYLDTDALRTIDGLRKLVKKRAAEAALRSPPTTKR